MRYHLVRRFFAKLVHDVLPAALASLIGGFVLTHYGMGYYGFGRPAAPPAPVAANAEMMDVLRDEHALVVKYLKAQVAKEKQSLEPAAATAKADDASPPTGDAAASAAVQSRVAAAKSAAPRHKASVVGSSLPPLVLTTDEQRIDPARPLRDDSLLAKTIGLKDHVVAATQRAVSAIGGIPSWFGSIGDRIGGGSGNPRPPADLVSTS